MPRLFPAGRHNARDVLAAAYFLGFFAAVHAKSPDVLLRPPGHFTPGPHT